MNPQLVVFLIPEQYSLHGADKFCSFLADETADSPNGALHEVPA